jgi:hypothetical protein
MTQTPSHGAQRFRVRVTNTRPRSYFHEIQMDQKPPTEVTFEVELLDEPGGSWTVSRCPSSEDLTCALDLQKSGVGEVPEESHAS